MRPTNFAIAPTTCHRSGPRRSSRGGVAEEISRCAKTEDAGLVVMGLRQNTEGRPGVIASAVLDTGRAFVLAVPAG